MSRRTLASRIILLSGTWILMALVGTAVLLMHYYSDHIEKHYDAHVFMHLEELVTASQQLTDDQQTLPNPPSDPRFNVPNSGWYWEVRHGGHVLDRSVSLGRNSLDLSAMQVVEGRRAQVIDGPNGQPIRVQALEMNAGPGGKHLLLAVSAPMMGITEDVIDIAEHMAVSFTLLAAGLIVAVIIQVRIALRPVQAISKGISDIHLGSAEKVTGEYPKDVQPLVDELNNLLDHNAVLLRRARNQMGDLAHSIKNPLTVINNEAHNMEPEQKKLILDQTEAISSSVDHHLTRARAFGTGNVLGSRSKIKPVAEDLKFALHRIYNDRNIEINLDGLGDCAFRGESQDLEEMLGNLMDNACKWARREVVVRCWGEPGNTVIVVEDDGPGIPDEQMNQVLQRGQRLDETKQGHGLGLGIVQDILELYGGKLTLGRRGNGGLAAELIVPGA